MLSTPFLVDDDFLRLGFADCVGFEFIAIESRVARIKARVAELTGGMPPPSSIAEGTKT